MAFQMSTLSCRFKIPTRLGVLTLVRATSSAQAVGPIADLKISSSTASRAAESLLNSGVRSPVCLVFTRLFNTQSSLYSGAINFGRSSVKFSTSLGASGSIQADSGEASSHRRARSVRRGFCAVLGALGFSAAVACLHSSSLRDMAAGSDSINLDSTNTDWKEAKKFLLSASLQERRAMYRTSDFLTLEQIPVWTSSERPAGDAIYPANEALNRKISLFRGDITKLEIDAIVNAANKTLLGGGGVDGSIHRGAGPLLKQECATLGGCETGQAKITGAYGLPAKYVIHTVGPIVQVSVGDREREGLHNCYHNCLDNAVQNQLRTVAFPCISTGVYGYPPEKAVDVALATVREYLEEHHAQLDRVIFCVFLKSDEDLYLERLPLYFPQGGQVKSKL
ncbi:hypothetical protein MATL_G00166510 [Megalops atlanticus]|uniref:Macro domain-containing protein n=1 Tax=Megalops atlanticus TaxID=7932 RepID=A0A9D3PQI7_MEGAT|nr:hypothetical protein MATL_G00166510 [Megalops atlanticus]